MHTPHKHTSILLAFITVGIVVALLTINFPGLSNALAQIGNNSQRSTKNASSPQDPDKKTETKRNTTTREAANLNPDLPPFMQGEEEEEGADFIRLRDEYINRLRGQPHHLSYDPRARAIYELEKRTNDLKFRTDPLSREINGTTWTAIGPAPIPNGQTQGVSMAVSGRVTAIAVHPTDPNKVYVGTAQGGVYRSLDGGTTWVAIFDNALSLAIGAIAIAPSSPTTIYVGTGEGNFCFDCFFGVGVYRIDNAETAPTLVGPLNRDASNNDVFSGASITKLLVNPNDANMIFVSTGVGYGGFTDFIFPASTPPVGLYRSTNAMGAAPIFTKLTVPTANNNSAVSDMVFEPGTPNNLLCAVRGSSAANDGGLWRSTNALAANPTFTQTLSIGGNTTVKFAINKVGATVTALAATGEASNSATCSAAKEGGGGVLRRSTDGGATWPTTLSAANGFCAGQCFYDIAVALDPGNASNMYIGGQFSGTCSGIFRKSTDAGATFPNSDTGLHADTHVITVAPSNASIIYFGSDGGVWKSTNSGTAWTSLNNSTFSATQFVTLAIHPTDRNFMIGGTQDNGTELLNAAATWSHADGGDAGFSLIDQNATDTTNVTMYHTYFAQTNTSIGLARVTNSGSATPGGWTFLGASLNAMGNCVSNNGLNCGDAVLFYPPMSLGPGNPNTLYYGTDRLYRSTDRGTTMTVVSQGPLVVGQPISAIGISPQNDSVRIVGTQNGQVFATTTGSNTLTNVTAAGFPAQYVARAIIDPTNANTAYVTFSGFGDPAGQHIWKTTNLNAATPTWTAAGNGIPDVPVNALVIDPAGSNILYAGTDIGVYNSFDGGLTWTPFSNGLPRVAVFDIALQNANRVLRIATHGRGIWEITPIVPQADLAIAKTSTPNPVNAGANLTYALTVTNNGPGSAAFVSVTDPLPANTTFLSYTAPAGWTCATPAVGTNGTVTCSKSTMTLGESATIAITVKVDPATPNGSILINNATVSTTTTDPTPSNNSASAVTSVQTSADLGISKTAAPVNAVTGSNPPAVYAGQNITYTINFGNAGPSNAQNVLITDQVPGNTSLVSAFPITVNAVGGVYVGGNAVKVVCSYNSGTHQITCTPMGNAALAPALADGVLPAGVTGTLSYVVQVNASAAGGTIVANAANITSAPSGTTPGTADPNTGNNTSLPTSTPVVAGSQLAITKVIQSATFATSPPAPAGAVIPGTRLTYRITVTNNGPSDVSNVRVTDVLPSGLDSIGRITGAKFVSVTPSSTSGVSFTCSAPQGVDPDNNPNGNGGSLACTAPLISATAPNNTAFIDLVVFIDPATKANLVDQARVDATINNFNQPTFSTITLTTPVGPTSDLALTKTHTPDPVVAGTSFTYTVTLTNNGPSTAQMVNLVDTFPAFQKLTAVQIVQTPDQNGAPNFTNANCTAVPVIGSAGNTTSLTCTAPELPPNKNQNGTVNPSGTVKFILTVLQDQFTPQPTPTTYANCVTATSMSFDPVAANNTNVCDTVNLAFQTTVSSTKVDMPDPVIAGNNLTYTITATNNGPSAALNFKISDPLPVGTVFISAIASPGATVTRPTIGTNGTVTATWDVAGGTALGLTGVGVTRTLTIVVRVCPDFQQILNLSDAQMCVPNLTDTATISTLTPGTPPGVPVVPASATASATTTVQAQSDLSISKSGPTQARFSITGSPSNITYTLTFSNAGPSNSSGTMIVDVLPKGFTVVGTPVSSVPSTTFTITTVDGVTTVKATLGVLGADNQCQLNRPTSGTITIVANVPIKHPLITVTNIATISTTNCLPDPNLANNTATLNTQIIPPGPDPGLGYPALAEVSDQKAGSILFYNIYTSDAVNGNSQNTRISITNLSASERVCVHLFAVDGASCAILDSFLCLTPNQTTSFLTSDFDPGNTGYLMALAVDCNTGLPRAYNCLVGDEYVKFSSGHHANLPAEAISASMMFPAGTSTDVTTTTLKFDGMSYNRLPRILAADNISSAADGNSTMLIVNRIGGNFSLSAALIGGFTGLVLDDQETTLSFTANQTSCQFRTLLSGTFPRTSPPFTRFIPAGRSGWLKFWSVNDSQGSEKAMLGSTINFNSSATSNTASYNQGHNLHKLTLTDRAEIIVPVFIPSC